MHVSIFGNSLQIEQNMWVVKKSKVAQKVPINTLNNLIPFACVGAWMETRNMDGASMQAMIYLLKIVT